VLMFAFSVALAAGPPLEQAARWAPVLYQDLADGLLNDPANRRRDLIAAVNFDGNYDPFDNAENADSGQHALTGSILYDVVETETHIYLLYSIFHPIDWNTTGIIDHENDMEHVWVIVQKMANGTQEIVAVATQAHGELLAWSDTLPTVTGFSISPGELTLEGEHPRVFVEPKGHGPALCSFPGGLPLLNPINCNPDADEDLVIYRALQPGEPNNLTEPDTSGALVESGYSLVWGYESIWPLRASLRQDNAEPPLWEDPFTWIPTRNTDVDLMNNLPIEPTAVSGLGSRMAGDEGGGAGTPPWGYLVSEDVLGLDTVGERGDWLLDPPSIHALVFDDPCASEPGFYNYLYHPYLDDLLQPGGTLPHDGIDHGRRCDGIEGGPADTADTADTANPDTSDSAARDTAGDTGDLTSSFKSSAGCGCTSTSSTSPTELGLGAMLLYTLRRSRRRSANAHPSSVQQSEGQPRAPGRS
jgi:MYXO-CTERM domain-containing protein